MFRQHDLTRALRAAVAAGLAVSGYEIDPVTGRIVVNINADKEQGDARSDLDWWLTQHGHKIYSKK